MAFDDALAAARIADAAPQLERIARDLARIAPLFDATSEGALNRYAAGIRRVANLARPPVRVTAIDGGVTL